MPLLYIALQSHCTISPKFNLILSHTIEQDNQQKKTKMSTQQAPPITTLNTTNTASLNPLKSILQSIPWFGFDLDDTLHEFRKASSSASSAVCETIHRDTGIDLDALKISYGKILRETVTGAFVDGRTSTEYRRGRFARLLRAHGLEEETTILERLLCIYQNHLKSALQLKPGALELLQTIKHQGKQVLVITEGPQDAQEWTVQELGIKPYIDILVTTNEVRRAKVDGLFSVVLEKYGIPAGDVVYVGDSEVRDVRPARAEGLLTVLVDERGGCEVGDLSGLCVDSLVVLGRFLM